MAVASGGNPDGELQIWDIAAGQKLDRRDCPMRRGRWSLDFAPDGRTLAIAGDSDGIRIWDCVAGQLRGILRARGDGPSVVAFAPDGKTLAASDRTGRVRIWDPATGRLRSSWTWTVPQESGMRYQYALFLKYSTDGRTLIATSTGGGGRKSPTVWLLDTTTGRPRASFLIKTDVAGFKPRLAAASPRLAIQVQEDIDSLPEIEIWDVERAQRLKTLSPRARAYQIDISPDGRIVACLVPRPRQSRAVSPKTFDVELWDIETGQRRMILTRAPSPRPHSFLHMDLLFSPDGSILAVGGPQNIELWDVPRRDSPPPAPRPAGHDKVERSETSHGDER